MIKTSFKSEYYIKLYSARYLQVPKPYPTGSRWELKELLAGDTDDLTRCPADLAPGDGLLPAGDNLFLMGRKLLPGGDP